MTEYITHMFDNVLTTFGLGIVNLPHIILLVFGSHAKMFPSVAIAIHSRLVCIIRH